MLRHTQNRSFLQRKRFPPVAGTELSIRINVDNSLLISMGPCAKCGTYAKLEQQLGELPSLTRGAAL